MHDLDLNFSPPTVFDVKPLKTGKVALFDADFLKYIIVDRIWKKGQETGIYPPVIDEIKSVISDIMIKIQDRIIFCFSGKSYNTFRYFIACEKEYKGNRNYKKDYREYDRKQSDFFEIIKYFIQNHNTLIYQDLEADDIVSFLQNDKTYIVSKDKDLKQISGYHYNFEKNDIYMISKDESYRNLMFQILTGDTTDNIPGVKGVGPVKANTIISVNKSFPELLQDSINEFAVANAGDYLRGLDNFVEMYNLIKTKEARGQYFIDKYALAFNLRDKLLSF